jgi:hypothetical protein
MILTPAQYLYQKRDQMELDKSTFRFYYEIKDGIAKNFSEIEDWRFMP